MATTGYYVNFDSVRPSWEEGLLILTYHGITTPPLQYDYRALYVEPSKFRSQLKELQIKGLPFVSLNEAMRHPLRERRVVVTFDDGYRDAHEQAMPILRELAIPAINYIVADLMGGTNAWDRYLNVLPRHLMSREEILEWLEAGHEIGSHTLTHPHLTAISPAEARREIIESKKKLEDIFSRPILHFCYPYGDWNERMRDLVAEAGYETACTIAGGYNLASHPLSLDRFTAKHRRPYAVALRGALLKPFKTR